MSSPILWTLLNSILELEKLSGRFVTRLVFRGHPVSGRLAIANRAQRRVAAPPT
jgi:hypothetical protein